MVGASGLSDEGKGIISAFRLLTELQRKAEDEGNERAKEQIFCCKLNLRMYILDHKEVVEILKNIVV
jgi:hypothetical protein